MSWAREIELVWAGVYTDGGDRMLLQLLKTERVAAYIEYYDPCGHSATEDLSPRSMRRKYLFHEWFSTVKVTRRASGDLRWP